MKNLGVKKTKYYSFAAGTLADGCRMCVKGEKLVLFVTGLCSQRCEFCPISDMKLYKDVVYANERPVSKDSDIVEEARISNAKGAGITGGDPLMKTERVCGYIKLLKKNFGKKFHIHLYTPLSLVNESRLGLLFHAGLDEIRFHPELSKPEQWERVLLARKYPWKVGVEIPVIPGKEEATERLVDYIRGKIDFLNLNELELADNEVWRRINDIRTKDATSYAIKGSDELARTILEYSASLGVRTHYCTCKLKDKVQLAARVKRRSKSIKKPTDKATSDGMLVRGAIYLPGLAPGFDYRKKLAGLDRDLLKKEKVLKKLERIKELIQRENRVNQDLLFIDTGKPRILTSAAIARRIAESKDYVRAVITEYPTFDALELEVEILR